MTPLRVRRAASILLAALLALSVVAPVAGAQSAAPVPDVRDPADLEAFFDAEMAAGMERANVPGAVVVVVVDGEVALLKGYGYADLATRTPVDPERTVFFAGSVAKPVTATAVMQLAEADVVALDADVTDYVDVPIPGADDPITLRHLGTHTAGFDYNDRVLGLAPGDVEGTAAYSNDELPPRVRPAGVRPTYDNYGLTLAGYVVERQSGQPFETYVERELFVPLGMTDSTFAQPVPDRLTDRVATGYWYADGDYLVGPDVYVRTVPTGALATTAPDMGRFLVAHLNEGCVDGACVLAPESVAEMHATQFRGHPDVNGMAYGFAEYDRNGVRALGHAGDTGVFSADSWFLPDHDVGAFVAFNAPGGAYVRGPLFTAFVDRYFPAEETTPEALPGFAERADAVAGEYRTSRTSGHDYTKVLGLFGTFRIEPAGEGRVSLVVPGGPYEFVEVEPYLFGSVDDPGLRLGFVTADDGTVYAYSSNAQSDYLRKLAWHERPAVHLGLAGVAGLLVLSGLVGWPGRAAVRRVRRGRRAAAATDGGRRGVASPLGARTLAGVAGVAVASVVVGLGVALSSDPIRFAVGLHPLVPPLLVVALVAAGLTVAAAAVGVAARRDPRWGRLDRAHFALVVLALATLVAELAANNLVAGL